MLGISVNRDGLLVVDHDAPRRRLEDMASGDYVLVGGHLKCLRRVISGVDLVTKDGRYYGVHSVQRFLKHDDLRLIEWDAASTTETTVEATATEATKTETVDDADQV